LNQRGEIRAAALAELFFPKMSHSYVQAANISLPQIDMVIAQESNDRHKSKRKEETASPIAKAGSLALNVHDQDDIPGLGDRLRNETQFGRNVLIVWDHSSVSQLVGNLLQLEEEVIRWPMDRYDVIWEIDLDALTLQQFCQHLLFGDLWCPVNPIQVYPAINARVPQARQQYYYPIMS
jgi:predicted 3-demethylubiquinone-9 3-methyltransferase (glyoxalase superfamily)